MIITREELNRRLNTFDDAINILRECNKERDSYNSFKYDSAKNLLNYSGVSIPFNAYNYKNELFPEMLMTNEEYAEEVKQGHIKGVEYKDGCLYFI